MISHRVFIVGTPRSGTTLLQSLLAAHGELTSFTESHFFVRRHFRCLPPTARVVLVGDPRPRVGEFLRENDAAPNAAASRLDGLVPAVPWRPFRTRAVAVGLLEVLDEIAGRRGVERWVEKTPAHLRVLPFLDRISGGRTRTSFVHVLRRGPEVVSSLYEASRSWGKHRDLDTCIARWNRDLALSAARIDGPDDHFVFYDRLVSETEATLRRLLDRLGLPWDPRAPDERSAVARGLITAHEHWKRRATRAIQPPGEPLRLTPAQRRRTEVLLRHELYDRLLERHRG